MPETAEAEKDTERKDQRRLRLNAVVSRLVLSALGGPGGTHAVQVRPLWGNFYRVNVLVGKDAASLTVADSYFLEVDGDGKLVSSNPALAERQPSPPPGAKAS